MSDTILAIHNDKRASVLLFFVVMMSVVLLHLDTITSIVSTWKSEAYSHGYIVVPVSAYLVWQKRLELAQIPISRSYLGLAAVAGLSVLWWISDSLGVQVIRQFAVVGMIPASALAVFGLHFTKEIRFPLCFLIFAIPFGEFLTPYLVEFTASFSVAALKFFGIPVLQDGKYFQVPSGSYEVAKACSGLRYFTATLALAVLYGRHLFVDTRKFILFVSFSLFLSILMNGIRATTIVLLLHFTDLDIAAGTDHEFIGWILFALMIGLLMWVGIRWGDSSDGTCPANPQTSAILDSKLDKRLSVIPVGVLVILAVLFGPFLDLVGDRLIRTDTELTAGLPIDVDGWVARDSTDSAWSPDYVGYSQMSLGNYARGSDRVDVASIRYLSQRQGAEITNATNSVVDLTDWTIGDIDQLRVDIDPSATFLVNEVIARSEGESRLIWYWTDVNGARASGTIETKLVELRNLLSGKPVISTAIILSAPIEKTVADTRALLHNFLSTFEAAVAKCLGAESNHQWCSLDAPEAKES